MPAAIDDPSWQRYARSLGLRLQKLRTDAGLTQSVLADRAGLTKSYYQQVERGLWGTGRAANPSIKVLVALAVALEAEVGDLVPSLDHLTR